MTEYHSILLQLYNTSTKKSIIDRRNTVNMAKNLNKYQFAEKVIFKKIEQILYP